MKASSLASSSSTELQLKHPVTDELVPLFMYGYTPDSKEWEQLVKKQLDPKKKQSLILGKKGTGNRIEIESDAADKQREVIIQSVTCIKGFDDVEETPQAAHTLLHDPNYNWMYEQWRDHVDDRSHFFSKSAKPATAGLKA